MKDDPNPKITEVLAGLLWDFATGPTAGELRKINTDATTAKPTWQENHQLRSKSRQAARELEKRLEEAGIGLRRANKSRLDSAIDDMTHIPRRRAYTPSEFISSTEVVLPPQGEEG